MTLFDREIADPGAGWRPWAHSPPPLDWLHLEIWRREWPGPIIVTPAEIHPAMNVAGLYWRTP